MDIGANTKLHTVPPKKLSQSTLGKPHNTYVTKLNCKRKRSNH